MSENSYHYPYSRNSQVKQFKTDSSSNAVSFSNRSNKYVPAIHNQSGMPLSAWQQQTQNMTTTEMLEYSKTTMSNKSQMSSRLNFRQILSPLANDTQDNKSLNTQNPLLTDKSNNDKRFNMTLDENDKQDLNHTCLSGSMLDSLYLRQNEITTTEEADQQEPPEPAFIVDKKHSFQKEVLDYKLLTQNALKNIEQLQRQVSLPLGGLQNQSKNNESSPSLALPQHNMSTHDSNRHNSQKSLHAESMAEKTPKISIKHFYTNNNDYQLQQPEIIGNTIYQTQRQQKPSPERFRHFSFSETKRRCSQDSSEPDLMQCIKIEQNSSQQTQGQMTITEVQQQHQQMHMTLVDHMRIQDYTDQPLLQQSNSQFDYNSQESKAQLQLQLRSRTNSASEVGPYFNGFGQNDSRMDHSSTQQLMTYDSSENRLNSAQQEYSKMLQGGMKMGSIHNDSITEKIRLLREDIHQMFPTGQHQVDFDPLVYGLPKPSKPKSADRSKVKGGYKVNRIHPNFDSKRPTNIPPSTEPTLSEIQLLNAASRPPQVLTAEHKTLDAELRKEIKMLQEKLIKQKQKFKEFKDRTQRRKEVETQKYQSEINQLKVELKLIEDKYAEETKRLEGQYAKYRQIKHDKFNKIMKDLQSKYEQQIEKERQINRQLEIQLSEAILKVEMISEKIRLKEQSTDCRDSKEYKKLIQQMEKQKDQEWREQMEKVKQEYEAKLNDLRSKYDATIEETQLENEEIFKREYAEIRDQKQKLIEENRKLNTQLRIYQFKNENQSCVKCQSLLVTNSRLLVKLNRASKNNNKEQRQSMSREKKHNLDYDSKSARRSVEPCQSRASKIGKLKDNYYREKQNATTVDMKTALAEISRCSNIYKTRTTHAKKNSNKSQRSCDRRKSQRGDMPQQSTTTHVYISSDEGEDDYYNK